MPTGDCRILHIEFHKAATTRIEVPHIYSRRPIDAFHPRAKRDPIPVRRNFRMEHGNGIDNFNDTGHPATIIHKSQVTRLVVTECKLGMHRPEHTAEIRRERLYSHRVRRHDSVSIHPDRLRNLTESKPKAHIPAVRRCRYRIGIAPAVHIDFCRRLEQVSTLDNLLEQCIPCRRAHVIFHKSRARATDPVVCQFKHIARQVAKAHRIRERTDRMQPEIRIRRIPAIQFRIPGL